jgi:hypothetical protein
VAALVLAMFATPVSAQTSDLLRAGGSGIYQSAGDFYTFTLEGSGEPFGDFTGEGDFTVGSNGEVDGEGIFHTGQGDVSFTFSFFLHEDGDVFFAGNLTINGGTDLYQDATGGSQLFGQIDRADQSFTFGLKGVITY